MLMENYKDFENDPNFFIEEAEVEEHSDFEVGNDSSDAAVN